MKTLAISLLVKTFQRPQCLKNLLDSVRTYQNQYQTAFAEVIIIDDSSEEAVILNQKVVDEFSDISICYKVYPFNQLGVSGGRNKGLDLIKEKYFILCDDDYIFDTNCDLSKALEQIKEKNIDILGGHYLNFKKGKLKKDNFFGFIEEGEENDYISIFTAHFPKYAPCHIVQNFYLAKTEIIRQLKYPENLPMQEHLIFFLRAKQKGIKVAYSSDLYVKHLHLSSPFYNKHRNREINLVSKPVLGHVFMENKVIEFDDYFHINTRKRYYFRQTLKDIIRTWIKGKNNKE
jgi:glycosyltransferase involved in cell wall biosynthesis